MKRLFCSVLVWMCAMAPVAISAQTSDPVGNPVGDPVGNPVGEPGGRQALARSYAEIVGRLALTDKLFAAMTEQCDTKVAMPSQSYSAIDYALRMQTNMSFFQWRRQFSDPAQEAKLVTQLMSSTLTDIGGCEESAVQRWFAGMLQNMLQPSIEQLSELPDLLGISRDKPDEEQLVRVFIHQLARYQQLSVAEVRGLAMALESGMYRYSMVAFTNQITKDYPQSVALREYVYQQTNTAGDLYELADSLRFIDRERAVTLFGEAAQQGSFVAQRWYGNYQACVGNTEQALLWLNKARQNEPDEASFIDDIISEIQELGEPTNCLDGWVY